jgi:hypothetical protein
VSKEGQTTIQTTGYTGSSCTGASKWLEESLGITTTEKKTTEYFEIEESKQHVQQ